MSNNIKTEIYYSSSNMINKVRGVIWAPEDINNAKAIIQLSHGMAEFIDRYDNFASFLNDNGFIVVGNDHIGHGGSYSKKEEKGFFADDKGFLCVVDDMFTLSKLAKEKFPSKKLFLLGHSMGSMMSRCYASKYSEMIDGLIISGTAGPNSMVSLGLVAANLTCKLRGNKFPAENMDKMIFSKYNDELKPARTKFDWLSRDPEIVDKYIADENCGFLFTARGFVDLLSLIKYVNDKTTFEKIEKKLPIFIISGDKDPVGDYGKGVSKVYSMFKSTAHEDVEMKLYNNYRHEILNEIGKEIVYDDIMKWLNSKI